MKANRSFLKPYVEDTYGGQPLPLFYHQRTPVDIEAGMDQWIVDKVIGHRINKKKGSMEFLTLWEGQPPENATWEPVENFFPKYNTDFVKYCREKGISVDIMSNFVM